MKLTAESSVLLAGLVKVKPFVKRGALLADLRNIGISVSQSGIEIYADCESAQAMVAVPATLAYDKVLCVTVDFDAFDRAAKGAGGAKITIEIPEQGKGKMSVSGETGRFEIALESAASFRFLQADEAGDDCAVDCAVLSDALTLCASTINADELSALSSLRIDIDTMGGFSVFSAIPAIINKFTSGVRSGEKRVVFLSEENVARMLYVLRPTVTVSLLQKNIFLRADDACYSFCPQERGPGNSHMDVLQAIQMTPPISTIAFDAGELKRAIEIAVPFSDKCTLAIEALDKGTLTVGAQDTMLSSSAAVRMPATSTAPVKFWVGATYAKTILSGLTGQCKIYFCGDKKPFLLRCDNHPELLRVVSTVKPY